jgi:hypothetical protein
MTPRDNQFFVAQLAAEAKGRCYHFDAATTKIHEMYPLNSETRNGPFSSALSSHSLANGAFARLHGPCRGAPFKESGPTYPELIDPTTHT